MNTIALDIGGTIIKIGLVQNGKVIDVLHLQADADKGLEKKLPELESSINSLLKSNNIELSELSGIGVSIPGIVDTDKAVLLEINDKYNDADTLNLRDWAKAKYNLPLYMDNDARSACVGEWQYGAAKGVENMVMVTLGTGFGASAVIDGRVLRGKHFRAGILGGHIIANADGLECNCGSKGCVEAHSSTWNIQNIARQIEGFEDSELAKAEILDFKLIFTEAKAGNEIATKIRNFCMDYWAVGIANLVYAYDPEIIVIGGGVMASADTIIPYLENKLKDFGWADFSRIPIKKAEYPNSAALLSAEYFISNYK
jgi:glucokinase